MAHGAFASARTGPLVFTPAGGEDTLVSRFDVSGRRLWTRSLGTEGYDEPSSIAVGPDGHIVVGGDPLEEPRR